MIQFYPMPQGVVKDSSSEVLIRNKIKRLRIFISVFCSVLCIAIVELASAQAPQMQGTDIQSNSANTSSNNLKHQEREMSLKECMEYAISNSTKMRIQKASLGDARIDRRDAALRLFTPNISAQTYAYYNFGRSIDPQTNTYFNTTSFHNNYSASVGYDLFNGFQAVNNYKISKIGVLIAESRQKQVEADICLAVMEAYYNVVYYKRLCDVYEEQVVIAEKALNRMRRQEELGQKGHADVVELEADLASRKYDLTNTYNNYLDQKMILADLMFWPVDEELKVVTDYRSFAIAQDDRRGNAVILREQCHPERSHELVEWRSEGSATEDAIIDFALEHNPIIQIASWKQLNAKRELNTSKWQLLPSLGIYAGYSTSYYNYKGAHTASFPNQFRNNRGEYVELSLSIPIWNRMSRHSKISKSRNEFDRASAELEQKRREVASEVRRAIQDCKGAALAYTQAQRKSEMQSEAYALNQRKLEQGLISPLEYQTASNNYLKAKSDELNSLFKYLIKRAVVNYYSGIEYVNQ